MDRIKKVAKGATRTRAKKEKKVEREQPEVVERVPNVIFTEYELLRHIVQTLVDSPSEKDYDEDIATALNAFEDKPILVKNLELIQSILPFNNKTVLKSYLRSTKTIVEAIMSTLSDPSLSAEEKEPVRAQYASFLRYKKDHEDDIATIERKGVQMVDFEENRIPTMRVAARTIPYQRIEGRYPLQEEVQFEKEFAILRNKPIGEYKDHIMRLSYLALANAFYDNENENRSNPTIERVINKLIGTLITKSKTVGEYAIHWSRLYPFVNSKVFENDATLFRTRLLKGYVSPFRVLELSIFDKIQINENEIAEGERDEPRLYYIPSKERTLYKRLEHYNRLISAEQGQFVQVLYNSLNPTKRIPPSLEIKKDDFIRTGRLCGDSSIPDERVIYYYDETTNVVYCFDIRDIVFGIADEGEEFLNKYTGRPFSREFVTSILRTFDIGEIIREQLERDDTREAVRSSDEEVRETDADLIRESPFLQVLITDIFDAYDEVYETNHSCDFCNRVIEGQSLNTYVMNDGRFVLKRYCDSKCLGRDEGTFEEPVEESVEEPVEEDSDEALKRMFEDSSPEMSPMRRDESMLIEDSDMEERMKKRGDDAERRRKMREEISSFAEEMRGFDEK